MAPPEWLWIALTIGAALSAVLTRQTRGAMIEVLSEQYILAARARGVSRVKVVFVHGLRKGALGREEALFEKMLHVLCSWKLLGVASQHSCQGSQITRW